MQDFMSHVVLMINLSKIRSIDGSSVSTITIDSSAPLESSRQIELIRSMSE